MPRYCSVFGCKSSDKTVKTVLHKVSCDIKEKWRREKHVTWKCVKNVLICDLHFENHDGKRLDFENIWPTKLTGNLCVPDHDYHMKEIPSCSEVKQTEVKIEQVLEENEHLKRTVKQLQQSNYYLKLKNVIMKSSLADFKDKVKSLHKRFELSHSLVESLTQCTSEVPKELFELTGKRARGFKRPKEYHPAIKRFALTLQMCSTKAYR